MKIIALTIQAVAPMRRLIVAVFTGDVKQVVSIDQRKVVRLLSKGTCHFQFAMKQRIDLKENPIKVGNEIMID
uniref:PTS EIIA type-1 domain-containing protein n=1 Tax=Angiostrongylus cantonensis TaxID=6313 RepID=A0A0K0DQY3_ANGCA